MGSLRDSLKINTPAEGSKKRASKKSATLDALMAEDDAESHVVTPFYQSYLEGLNGRFLPPDWSPADRSERAKGVLHPSSFSNCARQLQYEWLGEQRERRISAKTCMTFNVGHYMHKMIQTDLLRAGVLLLDEVPVIHRKLSIVGHTDGLLRWQDGFHALLEIKTINPRDFKTLVSPSPEYLIQANCYLLCVDRERKLLRKGLSSGKYAAKQLNKFQSAVSAIEHGLTQINFLYYDKGSGDTKEFIINRDEKIVDGIVQKANTILDAMDAHKLLPREGDSPNSDKCGYCPFKGKCFDRFNSKDVDWSRYAGR